MSPPSDREERFRALYQEHYPAVRRFVQRRAGPGDVDDVVAEAFLVAWRRLDDCPRSADRLAPWLMGVARHCLLNSRRGEGRRDALLVRVATLAPGRPAEGAESVADLVDLAAAWRGLRATDQEVLALTVFEDLTSAQAAQVLGITATAYRLRLSRARRALRRRLDPATSSILPTAEEALA